MWGLIVSVPDHCLSFYFKFGDASKNNVKHGDDKLLLWTSWHSYIWCVSLFNILILAFRKVLNQTLKGRKCWFGLYLKKNEDLIE